ncbi:putative LRR receptor-like serine/threonine-protein kinase [Apostasia shenzhenica]|uniref:non-specific serine/threonine protein kinase n=1 Tax=Apostasia shenzhenica TaxID=1088818 RepID=A0A2I0A2I5_9ASPA|nr:putative LRR receptor-like serine/threonine-protein kinase [Apostasia shenzhenica]
MGGNTFLVQQTVKRRSMKIIECPRENSLWPENNSLDDHRRRSSSESNGLPTVGLSFIRIIPIRPLITSNLWYVTVSPHNRSHSFPSPPLTFFCPDSAAAVESQQPAPADKEILVNLKSFLLERNRINLGPYADWNESEPSPCRWRGISCDSSGRVAVVDLRDSGISGGIFPNFSLLPALTRLDLSRNYIAGPVPTDFNKCRALRHLNLSHNLIAGELDLRGLSLLENLDIAVNRFQGRVSSSFPANCGSLVSLNISGNNFTGEIGSFFSGCQHKLQYLDLSLNRFEGEMSWGFWWLREFSVADNVFSGVISPETFPENCSLEALDLSGNGFSGSFPDSIANCSKLNSLDLWGNLLTGKITSGIGDLTELNSLFLGNNSFDRDLPMELLNCRKLVFLDISRNQFGGEIQQIFGNFTTLKFLILHSNSYSGGIEESGILELPNLLRLDLSFNNFSRKLPVSVADMPKIKLIILAYNYFYGRIPPEYGRILTLQVLDLSFNRLSGGIPPEIGNLTSVLWLMLANNNLTGEIPPEIGNCSSLLWLNIANNRLSGRIPPAISTVGRDPAPTFEQNRLIKDLSAGSSECLAMKRWMPGIYPPFSFFLTVMTRRSCRATWDHLLKGFGVFPVCLNSTKPIRTLDSSGYFHIHGNRLSGEIPPEIGLMRRLSLLLINDNEFSGSFPPIISGLPLIVLNASSNHFSGQIPSDLGRIQCLQILDLSWNNFSGEFPVSLNGLSSLNMFNISFNPFLYGLIPSNGQLATFDKTSFIGDPLIFFSTGFTPPPAAQPSGTTPRSRKSSLYGIMSAVTVPAFVIVAIFGFLCSKGRSRSAVNCLSCLEKDPITLEVAKKGQIYAAPSPPPSTAGASSRLSSPAGNGVRVFGLDKTAFTYPDILAATGNFSNDMVIGRGGCGVVYRGVLPDGRHVAVKKLQKGGSEGEREFRAEMEVVAGGHPNLVPLYGWCLLGTTKLLVYEYMAGGTLEDVIKDRLGFRWARRLEAAVGVARALVYLHHECSPAVVHRDVKASNVMMDGGGRARVTDFGMSRAVSDGNSHVSTAVAGTVGYVAPEYGQTWRATTKGDVYSFGVLAMELATGRRAVEDDDAGAEGLVEWLRRVGAEAAEAEAAEGWRSEEGGGEAMRGLMGVAMSCAAELPAARPDMREALGMLLNIAGGIFNKLSTTL